MKSADSQETREIVSIAAHEHAASAHQSDDSSGAKSEAWLDDDFRSLQRSQMGLAAYLELPFVHKWTLIVSLIVSMFLGWLAILLWPRSYESEAKLMVLVGRESVALDPTATTGQTLMLQKTQEEEINSVLEVLGSRKIAQLVVDELGEGPIIEGVLPTAGSGESTEFQKYKAVIRRKLSDAFDACIQFTGVRDDISDRELAIMKLQKQVSIFAPKKSSVVSIRCESKTPEMAQAIVQSVSNRFLEEYLDVSRTEGSQEFFRQQSDESESRLNRMVDQRSSYMQERKLVTIEDNRRLLTGQLAAIDADLLVASAGLEQANSEIEDLQFKVAQAADEVVANKLEQSDVTWSGMRQRVYELELQEKQLAAIYTEGDERLLQVRTQLQGAREILAKAQTERVDESTTPNPAKLRMQDDLRKLETRVVGLKSSIAAKQGQRGQVETAINELLTYELELTEMDRNIGVAEARLRILQEKLEEARVIEQLQAKHISNINQFQDATYVERAVRPSKKIVAVAFVLFGLMAGFGLAYTREICSNTLRTTAHVEESLDCRVLSELPRTKAAKDVADVVRAGPRSLLGHRCKSILSDVVLSRTSLHDGEIRGRTLGVLGINEGCGASTLAAALAVAASEDGGLRATLVDADLRDRAVSKAFSLNGAPGLAEMLSGNAEHVDCIQFFGQKPLELISGSAPDSAQGFEADPRVVSRTLLEFQQDCDLTVVDLPPASRLDQAAPIVRELDQVLLVLEAGKTTVTDAERVLRRMQAAETEVVGVVLNKSCNPVPRWIRRIVG